MSGTHDGLIAAMDRAAPGYAGDRSTFFVEIARRLVSLYAFAPPQESVGRRFDAGSLLEALHGDAVAARG